jgi:hypothetical protein
MADSDRGSTDGNLAGGNLADLLTDTRANLVLAWILVGMFALVAIESVLTADYLWAAFAVVVVLVVVLPPLATRQVQRMPPWEVVLLAGLPVVGRAVATLQLTSTLGTYLSIAALALLVAVDIHMFTTVRMNVGFAVLFVVVTTLAAAGLWALVRWGSDLYLGTELLLVPGPDGVLTDADMAAIEEALMWEFVASGVVGLVAGLLFEGYIRRRSTSDARIGEEGSV